MATSTPNYGLKKFENGDPPDLPSLSASMDKIDTQMKEISDKATANETNIGSFKLTGGVGAVNFINENLGDNQIYLLSIGRRNGLYLISTFAGVVAITTIVDSNTTTVSTTGGLNLTASSTLTVPWALQRLR